MGFACPQCSENNLAIGRSIELPADSRSDEITLQVVKCEHCGFGGVAVYQESRRGALDSEAWEHVGYQINDPDLKIIVDLISACPQPLDAGCHCFSHRSLGEQNDQGRWSGLNTFNVTSTFAMQSTG